MQPKVDNLFDEFDDFQLEKIIKKLKSFKGNGTSLISFYIPSGSNIPQYTTKITEQLSKCSNIKSKENAKSVESGLKSLQQKIKQFKVTPRNGIAIFCGTAENFEGKEEKICITVQTQKPIPHHIYHCDSSFYTRLLEKQLESHDTYGFIVIDGKGKLLGTLKGSTTEILLNDDVYIDHKHNKGGQSAGRFFRNRILQRLLHLKDTADQAKHHFINSKTNLPTVKGIFVAGCADFKEQLIKLDSLDNRLKNIIIRTVTVSYGGVEGFMEAIGACEKELQNVPFIEESKIVSEWLEHINKDDRLYCFGAKETVSALEAGAVEKLLLFKDCPLFRFVEKSTNDDEIVSFKTLEEFEGTVGYTLTKKEELDDYFRENLNGSTLHIITGKTIEGNQFVRGFGGIGAILRYPYEFNIYQSNDYNSSSDDEDFL